MAGSIDLVVSTAYIGVTIWIAYWLRLYALFYLNSYPLTRILVLEFIATAELCGACFELIIIADNWGVWMYALYLFLLTIWWSLNWDEASACPYTHMEDVVEGKKPLGVAFLSICAELAGGLIIFKYIQMLWAFQLVSTHKNRAYGDCTTDLQVSAIIGTLVECIATCICRVVSRVLADLNPRFSTVIDAFVGTALVVAAFNYTGGYFNPALATSLKYGCLGTTSMEHMIVYWIGACVGSIASLRVHRMPFVQNYIQLQESKDTVYS
ncbi:aquaporin-11 [Camponotus floridanus]|uniref:aquaporin-11 n=1 Tax=Camponotus floridanus TaxID=104421 RepID=UPI00059B70B3|nr:aquaporin-11 [Camponotus floridanus]